MGTEINGIHQLLVHADDVNAGQNHDIKIGKRSFEYVAHFKYFRTTITNRNLIQEEIKRRLNSGNACCRSVQDTFSSRDRNLEKTAQ
jgi:hypothetical protein